MNSYSENSLTTENHARQCPGKGLANQGRFNILPDDILLEIFDFYADGDPEETRKRYYEVWLPLVHVCRRWRCIVFGSPFRLDLRLCCTAKTPARESLYIWPALPLSIQCDGDYLVDNVIAVLECRDRVEEVELFDVGPHLLKVLTAMQEPFPELSLLRLVAQDETVTVIPSSFLGRSAPLLEVLELDGIPFPNLPKLLLSTTFLTNLYLKNIPYATDISPKVMVTALSTLTNLETLWIEFGSFQHHRYVDIRRPRMRFVLPVLTFFRFEGNSEYLEDLVVRIDAPQLSSLYTIFFDQDFFKTPQLVQFIYCTSSFKAFENARIVFEDGVVMMDFWQLSNVEQDVEQVCASASPPPSTPEVIHDCKYEFQYLRPHWQDHLRAQDTRWLELLIPFTAVQDLYLSEKFAELFVTILQELVGSKTTEVLPSLQNIFLEGYPLSGPVQEGIRQFVASRQFTSHPITVSRWDTLEDEAGSENVDV